MAVLDTTYKRKSAVITTVILLLFLFAIFNYGMTYLDPPEEYGLAINFGDSNVGNGVPVVDAKKTAPKEVVEEIEEEEVEEVVAPKVTETPKEVLKEEIIREDTPKDVPVVEKVKEVEKKPVKEVPKEIKKEVVKPKPKPKLKPSKENQEALNSLLNGNSSEGKPVGEGDDDVPGVKGNENGDANSSKYYGNAGGGEGGNYNLVGRKVLLTSVQEPDCQEVGTVVVRIQVDNKGKVIYAKAGEKGTTNSALCLYKAAEKAAYGTKWNADEKAPSQQVGTIVYKFTLTK